MKHLTSLPCLEVVSRRVHAMPPHPKANGRRGRENQRLGNGTKGLSRGLETISGKASRKPRRPRPPSAETTLRGIAVRLLRVMIHTTDAQRKFKKVTALRGSSIGQAKSEVAPHQYITGRELQGLKSSIVFRRREGCQNRGPTQWHHRHRRLIQRTEQERSCGLPADGVSKNGVRLFKMDRSFLDAGLHADFCVILRDQARQLQRQDGEIDGKRIHEK